MAVLRIVANLASPDPAKSRAFYEDFLGLNVAMDLGWIVTFAAPATKGVPQVSVASEGGSGTDLPDLSIEVDDVDAAWARAAELGIPVVYPLTDEPWGVRRFFVKDPNGKIVNILGHG